MIARLAIAPEVLDDLGALSVRDFKRAHHRLLSVVQEHGALIFADDESAGRFVQRILSSESPLPPDVRKRWGELAMEYLKVGRLRAARPPLTPAIDSSPMADLGAAWASAVDVAVVGETMADLLGIPDDDGLMADPATGFEVALADWVAVTNHLTAIKELRDRGFHAQGRSRDDFWREVLAPIWSVSTHATVVDRYLFRKIWNGKRDEHVRWLLRRLNETPGKRGRVVLIGEALSSVDADMDLVLQVISEACQGGRIDAVTVQLTPPHRGSSPYLPHDRHIRFDNAAVYLNAGFDRLSCSTITAPDGLVWEYRWAHDAMQALRAVEKRALRARGLRTEFDPSS